MDQSQTSFGDVRGHEAADGPWRDSSPLENLPEELFRYVVQLACKLPPLTLTTSGGGATSGPRASSAMDEASDDLQGQQSRGRGISSSFSSPSTSTSSPLDVPTCLSLLLSDRRCHSIVLPLLYRDVTLVKPSKLVAFSRTLSADPKKGLLVRSLWVGPLGEPQRMPRLVYLGHDLLLCALADPNDATGEAHLPASQPLRDHDSRLMGHLRFHVLTPLFRRIIDDLLDIYPQVPVRGFPSSSNNDSSTPILVQSVEELSEPTREQWLAAPVIGMSNWVLRAEMTQSALQFLVLIVQIVAEACCEALEEVRDSVGLFEGEVRRLDDEGLKIAMEEAEKRGATHLTSLLTAAPYEVYLDLFVSLTSRFDIEASVAASIVTDRFLQHHLPWWTSSPQRPTLPQLKARYGPHRDCREDDFGSHLLYARSGQARLLIPDNGGDPLSTGIEEADVDSASDRASQVESDEGSERGYGHSRGNVGDAVGDDEELDEEDDDDEEEDEEEEGERNHWAFEPPHSARSARRALDRADRFGPRHIPWSRRLSDHVMSESRGIVRSLGMEGRNMAAIDGWSLGSLLGSMRVTLSLTPMCRCLAVEGFLERAVAGERRGASLKNLRHLSIGPPPANWSAPLHLRTLSPSLRSIDVSGCMLFDEEVADLVGLNGSLPNLVEITWRLWLPHSTGHALTAAQTVRRMLDLKEAERGLVGGRTAREASGSGRIEEGKGPKRRRVHAVLHELDVQAVRQALNLPSAPIVSPSSLSQGPMTRGVGTTTTSTSVTGMGTTVDADPAPRRAPWNPSSFSTSTSKASSLNRRLKLSVAPTNLYPNIVATRKRFASKAGFGDFSHFGETG